MKLRRRIPTFVLAWVGLAALLAPPPALAQSDGSRLASITTPEAFLGFEIGADYHLATYEQLMAYWDVLARESDRMVLRSIGETEFGRPHLQAILTAPENHANLDHYREISSRLARARGVDDTEARRLAAEGKTVIWIDGGLHATEVLGAQQLMQLVYDMVSRNDDETLRFLDDIILLATHANPDGHALVANWYMRNDDPMGRSTSGVPELYQKYAGHDNNRDFYMANLAETQNMNRVMYTEWYPQIVYNHHQTGPAGTVMFAPPFRDPMNHFLDPMLKTSLDQVGSAMHQRFIVEGKGGTGMRSTAGYSTWWNGGLRTTPYFHNQIGLLTETIGHPNPVEIPFVPRWQISSADLPLPVEPGTWHFKQSIDYSQTANRAVLDYASRNREHLLYNMWRMGMNSIERGSQTSWTVLPFEADAAEAEVRRGTRADWERLLRAPEDRDPRGFILTAEQPDFPRVEKFVDVLLMNGVEVHQATADFAVAGTAYPAGSIVVRADQAFRPQVLDMFEPQQHPNDFAFPGAPPTAPYDNAGWTVALQMGVEFDRILDDFDGPFRSIDGFRMDRIAADIDGPASGATGFVVDHRATDAFILVNRALAEGGDVYWLTDAVSIGGTDYPEGAFFFDGEAQRGLLATGAHDTGVGVLAVASRPQASAMKLQVPRIGLWDQYGGSMPSGWTRFVLEQFEFDYEVVYPPELDAGNLRDRFDVLVFPDGAIPGGGPGGRRGGMPDEMLATLPEELRDRVGSVSVETTVPALLAFLEAGGTAITVGSSTALGMHAGLPISDYLVDENGQHLSAEEYYTPGSVHQVKVDGGSPITHGLGETVNVLHSHSPVFRVDDNASNVRVLARYDSAHPLLSGWAWGQEKLEGGASMLEADVGQGKLFMFGPKITFRGQSHATFPLLFNGIFYGSAQRNVMF
jgi:hypothetical protein